MEIKGKVHEIGAATQVTETFKKRDLVIEYAENPSFPEYIKFEALQDKTNLFDNIKVGDQVEVFFNLRGRPWTDRTGKTAYFNSLIVWRVNVLAADVATGAPAPEFAAPADLNASAGEDDLPF